MNCTCLYIISHFFVFRDKCLKGFFVYFVKYCIIDTTVHFNCHWIINMFFVDFKKKCVTGWMISYISQIQPLLV